MFTEPLQPGVTVLSANLPGTEVLPGQGTVWALPLTYADRGAQVPCSAAGQAEERGWGTASGKPQPLAKQAPIQSQLPPTMMSPPSGPPGAWPLVALWASHSAGL